MATTLYGLGLLPREDEWLCTFSIEISAKDVKATNKNNWCQIEGFLKYIKEYVVRGYKDVHSLHEEGLRPCHTTAAWANA